MCRVSFASKAAARQARGNSRLGGQCNPARILAALLWLSITPGVARAQAAEPLLKDALAAIERSGVRLIYSSQLVPPGLRTRNPAHGATIAEQLESLLAPLHLEARHLSGGGYVIVSAPGRPSSERPTLGNAHLDQIVVQASRYRSSIGGSMSLTREALQNSPETHNDAVRALQVIPGTAVAGYTARTHVRGSRDDEILFRYDGVTLNQPYHLKELQSLFSPVDPTAVESVTSWTGIAPIEFGDQIGGVVDIKPRRITRPTADIQASEQGLSAMTGTAFAGGRGSVFADVRLQNEYSPVAWIDTHVGAPTLNDLIVHATWEFDPRTQLTTGMLAIDDRRKYFSAENAQNKAVNGGETYAWLRLHHEFSADVGSETIVSSEDSHENVAGGVDQPNIAVGTLNEHSWHSVFTAREEVKGAPTPLWSWHVGAEAEAIDLVDLSSGTAQFSAPFVPALRPSAVVVYDENVRARAMTYALYAGVRRQLAARTIIDIGLRRDQRKFRYAPADRQWSFRANVRQELSAATTLRLGWGQESQADIFDPHVAAGVVDPRSVRRVNQTNVSVEHYFRDRSAFRAEAYYKRESTPYADSSYIFSPFALLPELAVDKVRVQSQRSRMYGIELSVTSDRARPLSGSFSYVWSRAEDEVAGSWIARTWDQPHAVKINGLWHGGPWSVAGSLSWHSGWPYTRLLASTGTWVDPSTVTLSLAPLNSARLSNFFSLDLRLAWQHRLGVGQFQAFLNVYDMTDTHNACCRSYAVLNYPNGYHRLVESRSPWLSLTPVVGFRWHF